MSAASTKKNRLQKRRVWLSFLMNILAIHFKVGMVVCAESQIWELLILLSEKVGMSCMCMRSNVDVVEQKWGLFKKLMSFIMIFVTFP
jgi:hypothetical protein